MEGLKEGVSYDVSWWIWHSQALSLFSYGLQYSTNYYGYNGLSESWTFLLHPCLFFLSKFGHYPHWRKRYHPRMVGEWGISCLFNSKSFRPPFRATPFQDSAKHVLYNDRKLILQSNLTEKQYWNWITVLKRNLQLLSTSRGLDSPKLLFQILPSSKPSTHSIYNKLD